MFETVKQWFWYDWIMFIFRLILSISLMFTTVQFHAQISLPLWALIVWQIFAFSVPWLCLQLSYKYYLLTEIIFSGGLCLYLTYFFPEAYLAFLTYAFLIAVNSAHKSYRWTGPVTILLLPILINVLSNQSNYWVMMIHIGLAYAIGFAFHLLVVNHRQSELIREQNTILQQYFSQIERITLAEERDRLSKDLHDTVGHSYTSIIMGLETLRPELSTEAGKQNVSSLLNLARRSLKEIRGYLHQVESPQEIQPMLQSLQQLVEDFQAQAKINVHFRTFGEEYPLPKMAKMAFYRCLQESLTNAVRHGESTEITATLKFEQRQVRLEIQDNGKGMEEWQDGFGLNAMKERAMNLQGQVSVYSEPGEGTLVTCTLPRQVELSDEIIRLLIVDDQAFIRESLRTILEGHKDLNVVGLSEDGLQAIESCEQDQPQVILLDLDMPNMDGISATKIIKQKWPHIRILILTTFQDTEQALEVLRSGADGYLSKSIEPRELAETIRLVYRGGTLIDQEMSHKLFEKLEMDNTGTGVLKPKKTENFGLTSREMEILQLVCKGLRYKTIAAKLYLSDGTVRNYASTVYMKLGVRNREEAVQKAIEAGFLE
ncbi:DNA-binding NarL/FixJ family response regulator/signal transduction histidine kinase [Paenibacillus sp. W4I10]|uniref:helix-turn-helix transcriptional regulator n=1 Tax=Paenibacillus sp. W4I10 TaxID=3042298 RepID=UPI00277F454F|nr:hybrid sensor histidine kinase/response regulator transcription factor [Paenibacillus sp. W4I10]MDQ0724741.1 DNA-binding NarL/FixJ family response regulator/signal transduction histidine kinase [Paenibacillus sp. W4I10]